MGNKVTTKHLVVRPNDHPYTAPFLTVVDALNSAVKMKKEPWQKMKLGGFRLAKLEILENK